MRDDIFVETSNVASFRRSLGRLLQQGSHQPGFLVVQGKSGRGKTQTALNWHVKSASSFLRVWEGWTQHAFMQALAREITGAQPHGAYRCKVSIVDSLSETPRALIVDEADRLKIERLEDLRDIQEAAQVPVVLIGEEGFYPQLKGRQRLYSRVAEVVEFEPVSSVDVLAFAAQAADLTLAPEAAEAVAAAADGSFRTIYNLVGALEEFAKTNQLKRLDLKALQASSLLKKGKNK